MIGFPDHKRNFLDRSISSLLKWKKKLKKRKSDDKNKKFKFNSIKSFYQIKNLSKSKKIISDKKKKLQKFPLNLVFLNSFMAINNIRNRLIKNSKYPLKENSTKKIFFTILYYNIKLFFYFFKKNFHFLKN
jgi:hypothetical protein